MEQASILRSDISAVLTGKRKAALCCVCDTEAVSGVNYMLNVLNNLTCIVINFI